MLGCHLGCLDGTEQPEATLRKESSVGGCSGHGGGLAAWDAATAGRCDAMRCEAGDDVPTVFTCRSS